MLFKTFIKYLFLISLLGCRPWNLEKVVINPKLSTYEANNILYNSARLNGSIDVVGSEKIDEFGHCWSTSPNPTINNSRNVGSTETVMNFYSDINNLTPNKTYYFKAYAIVKGSVFYGNELSFVTKKLPRITVIEGNNFSEPNKSLINVNIEEVGEPPLTRHGVCWSTSPNPTVSLNTKIERTSLERIQSYNIENLQPNTRYFLRTFAINSLGTFYSEKDFIWTTACALLKINTQSTTNITNNSAILLGDIIDVSCDAILQYGHCWSMLNKSPTLIDSYTELGTIRNPINNFRSNISNLQSGATYYYRAYATDKSGTSYGEVLNFTTACSLPIVMTNDISNIGTSSATIQGAVTTSNCINLSDYGVHYSTSSAFTTISVLSAKNNGNPNNFTVTINNLEPQTTYFIRAYATNTAGTAFGVTKSFTTICPPASISISSIISNTPTTASATASILDLGCGNRVIQRGHCWATTPSPTINNTVSQLGSTNVRGDIITNITGLLPNTDYYIRAYTTNPFGTTSYGTETRFRTSCTLGVITTTGLKIPISSSSANVIGSITNLGCGSVSAYGFCWSETPNPTTANTSVNLGSLNNPILPLNIEYQITKLSINKRYYVRSFITNPAGTSYGNEIDFTTNCGNAVTTMDKVTEIKSTTATIVGYISEANCDKIIEYGHCWSTTKDPIITDKRSINLNLIVAEPYKLNPAQKFTTSMSNLAKDVIYYVRAYSVNKQGIISYSSVTESFRTLK